MGLGPPVCQHCQVIGILLPPTPIVRTETTTNMVTHTCWVCPICDNTDLQEHAGFGDWTKYNNNEKFLTFVKGKDK